MIKTLTQIDDSYAVVTDGSIMDLLHIQPETPLEITTEAGRIIITPVLDREARKQNVREARDWVNKRHGKALKKLAE